MRRRDLAALCAGLGLFAGCTSGGSSPTEGTAPATVGAGSSDSSPSQSRSTDEDWATYHGTPDRRGVSSTMPPVTGTPRVTAQLRLDGAVYAAPLVIGGTTLVATENDTVYAFDAAYRQKWKVHLGDPSPSRERPCGNIDPLGITGTPVYDATSGLVYVSPEFGGPPRHELVALDPVDGSVSWRRGMDLAGTETKAMQQRGALTVAGGRVWVPFGGLDGDCGGYKGRLVGVRLDGAGSLIAYTLPTTREAGIWAASGPAVDAGGKLYVAVGNGASGARDRYDFSDSVLQIGTDGRLVDSFSPSTWAADNAADLDLGSQGPAIVGRWLFIAGKSGTAYVLRRGHLGGIGGQVSQADVCTSFGGAAVVGDVVYVPCTDGVRAVRIDAAGTLNVRWHASGSIAGSPVVGGGRVWALDPGSGVLHALDPKTGTSREQIGVGMTSRFATPAITGSDVFVPTLAGLTVVTTS